MLTSPFSAALSGEFALRRAFSVFRHHTIQMAKAVSEGEEVSAFDGVKCRIQRLETFCAVEAELRDEIRQDGAEMMNWYRD